MAADTASCHRPVRAASATEPGVAKPDPILVADGIRRQFGGITAVDVEHLEFQRGSDHGADRPERRRQDHLLQPAHRVRRGRPRAMDVRRQGDERHGRPQDGAARHGAHLPAHEEPHPPVGHREHEARRHPPAGRERVERLFKPIWGAQEKEIEAKADGAARAVQARPHAGRVRRQPLRRPAQAAGDGAGADGRARAGHAGRADGRREPGAHPEPARPRSAGAGRGADRASSSSTTWTWSRTSATGWS